MQELTPVDATAAKASIDGITPRGWTPIGPAMRQAADLLPDGDGAAMMVVISDGENKCEPPPCDIAKEVTSQRPGVKISTVGFRASDEGLECVARSTEGMYVTADNADQLGARLVAVLDPETAAAQLSPQGAHGISLGMSLAEAAKEADGFPTDGAKSTEDGRAVVTIEWRDCTWTFTDDALTSITPKGEAATTIDGVTIGDPISAANRYYGEPVVRSSGEGLSAGQKEYLYPVVAGAHSDDEPTGWKVITDSSDTIVTISLCRCAPEKWRSAEIRLQLGGGLVINGDNIAIGDQPREADLVRSLGEPDEKKTETSCGGPWIQQGTVPLSVLRWGDFVVALTAQDMASVGAVGSVAGWEYGPVRDGAQAVPTVTGPDGVVIGDNLAKLRTVFGENSEFGDGGFDFRGVLDGPDGPAFVVREGTEDAGIFTLDDADRVVAMSSGWSCD